jgi:hypothetical protein
VLVVRIMEVIPNLPMKHSISGSRQDASGGIF